MPKTTDPVIPAGGLAAMAQPVIEVDGGLRLRPWNVSDATVLLTAYEDPAIRHYHGRFFASAEEAESFIAAAGKGWIDEKFANWAIVLPDPRVTDDTVVGRAGLSFVDLEQGLAEISYWVLPAWRGGGVAGRAAAAITAWSFDVLGIHRLEIMHAVDNRASCAIAIRAGFEPEGTLRSYLLHDDGWHDMHLHSRIKPD